MTRICLSALLLVSCFAFGQAATSPAPPTNQQPQSPAAVTPSAPSAAPAATVKFPSDFGFSYWYDAADKVLDMKPAMPLIRQRVEGSADSDAEKKGASCTDNLLTTKSANGSVTSISAMSADCMGMVITSGQLASFSIGVLEGLKQSMDIKDPVYGAYINDKREFWVMRSEAVLKSVPDRTYLADLVMTTTPKGVLFCLSLATDTASRAAFEKSKIQFDGGAESEIVPARAF